MKLIFTLSLCLMGYSGLLAQQKIQKLSIENTHKEVSKNTKQPYVVLFYNSEVYAYSPKEAESDDRILQTINPDWIEKVNILKGESSSKKYGDQGINGVIEITLKSGVTKKKLKPLLNKTEILIK